MFKATGIGMGRITHVLASARRSIASRSNGFAFHLLVTLAQSVGALHAESHA